MMRRKWTNVSPWVQAAEEGMAAAGVKVMTAGDIAALGVDW